MINSIGIMAGRLSQVASNAVTAVEAEQWHAPKSVIDADYDKHSLRGPDYPKYEQAVLDSIDYLPEKAQDAVLNAYHFANHFHQEHKKRHTGEEYISHPVEVMGILASFHVDEEVLVAALLHDVYEDHSDRVSLADITRYFGSTVASIVDGVTKISEESKVQRRAKETLDKNEASANGEPNDIPVKGFSYSNESTNKRLAERVNAVVERASAETDKEKRKNLFKYATIRKLLEAAADESRTIMVKLGDRLHNMRTLDGHPKASSRERIAKETKEILVPIAGALGLYKMKCELEDLCFKYLDEEAFENTRCKVEEELARRREDVLAMVETIKNTLQSFGLVGDVEYQTNSLFTAYQTEQQGRMCEVDAIRIVIPDDEDCYEVMGKVLLCSTQALNIHSFINTPKRNLYRAIHTGIFTPNKFVVPVHICNREHALINDYGIAAFYSYYAKDKTKVALQYDGYNDWLRSLKDASDKCAGDQEYVELLCEDLLVSDVQAFTPEGEAIMLPFGSVPLDFAYRIHTDIGHTCVAAQVNGVSVDILTYKIKNLDSVVIQTSPSARPRREWHSCCRTTKARNAIRDYFMKVPKEQNIEAGRVVLREALTETKLLRFLEDAKFLTQVASDFKCSKLDEFYRRLGCWQISYSDLCGKLCLRGAMYSQKLAESNSRRKVTELIDVAVVDPNRSHHFRTMKCCTVVYGDSILGCVAKNGDIRVHKAGCESVRKFLNSCGPEAMDRVVALGWLPADAVVRSRAGVYVDCEVHPYMMGSIIGLFDEQSEHICEFSYTENEDGTRATMHIFYRAASADEVNIYMSRIFQVKGVKKVGRL